MNFWSPIGKLKTIRADQLENILRMPIVSGAWAMRLRDLIYGLKRTIRRKLAWQATQLTVEELTVLAFALVIMTLAVLTMTITVYSG